MAKSGLKLKILYSEGEPEVLAAQSVMIQKAGHEVQTAVGRKAVEEALHQGKFDLVVLGSTLSKNDRHHLPYMVKKANETTRVLVMHADGGRHPSVDGNMDTGYSVEALIEMISSMMAKPAAFGAGAGR
jgi:DNA-binding NtrC family response regulator